MGPDLGYPCSIELDDGSIYTVYYSPVAGNSNSGGLWVENTIIEWSRWKLPERK